jgi:hypothetical protein
MGNPTSAVAPGPTKEPKQARRHNTNQPPNAKNDLPEARTAQQTITYKTAKRGETTKGPRRERNPKSKVSRSTKVNSGERDKVERAFGRDPPILAPKNATVFRLRLVQECDPIGDTFQ